MSEQFSTNKAKIEFLYSLRVNRWEEFRYGLNAFLNEQKTDLCSALFLARDRCLPTILSLHRPSVCKLDTVISRYVDDPGRHPDRRKSNATLFPEIKTLARKPPTYSDRPCHAGQDFCDIELAEMLQEHETIKPENLMVFMCKKINSNKSPLLKDAECHLGEDRGTRGYMERKQPHIEARLGTENVAIANPETLPDVVRKLPHYSPFRDKPGIRLSSTVRLMSNGFGCLRLKVYLANIHGLLEEVEETVFTTEGRPGIKPPLVVRKKISLSRDLRKIIVTAVRRRSMSAVEAVLQKYSTYVDTECLNNRLQRFIDGVTLVRGELTAEDIVDIENLDRGFDRKREPHLIWGGLADSESTLYEYFKYVIYDVFLKDFREALLQDSNILDFINRPERRQSASQTDNASKEQLISSLSSFTIYNSPLAIKEHPYVSTFLSAPMSFKKQGLKEPTQVLEHFRNMVNKYRKDLAKILMKSKWAEIRSNWHPADSAMENVFYSDLVHIAVHIRSTLCLYYMPASADEYRLFPELAYSYKYREELNDTLQSQRILWYAYALSDYLVTQDIREISTALEDLKEKSLKEEFVEVIEGLAKIIKGIDHRKIALTEVMEDPLSKKGGSSLFSEMINKASDAFHLDTLYKNLHNKVERLDMLGIHVSENVQEYSGLLVQEGTRATQLTLEFLEAFIIGFYIAELSHVSLGESERYPFNQWWGFFVIAIGAFLTALPLITMIRKGRTKIFVENPQWLERLEELGKVVGPALLFMIACLALSYAYSENTHKPVYNPIIFSGYHPLIRIGLFITGYLVVILPWSSYLKKVVSQLLAQIKGLISWLAALKPKT